MSFTFENESSPELVLVFDSQSQISMMAKRQFDKASVSVRRVCIDIRSSRDTRDVRFVPTVLYEHQGVRHVMPGHITSDAVAAFVSKLAQ